MVSRTAHPACSPYGKSLEEPDVTEKSASQSILLFKQVFQKSTLNVNPDIVNKFFNAEVGSISEAIR